VKKKTILLVISGLTFFIRNSSANNYGAFGAQILDMRNSARIIAMGDAGAGFAHGVNAMYYNPAGMTRLSGTEVQLSHRIVYLDTVFNSVSFAHKVGRSLGNVIEDFLDRKLGERIYRVGIGLAWKNFSARDTIRDITGQETGGFDVKYSQYTAGFGYSLTERHSLGMALNVVTENIYDQAGNTAAFDFGWHYRFYTEKYYIPELGIERAAEGYSEAIEKLKITEFGIVLKNVGFKINTGEENSLPAKIAAGAVHEPSRQMAVVWETFMGQDQTVPGFKCGLETEIARFTARAGLIYTTNFNFTFGFGIPERNWHIDYAAILYRDLGLNHRFSYGVHF
jgi:hypothetical protein